ncbi:S-adenosyl-L-methionine-dependent methyltransferase [Aspergillus ambiguus]|uniref:class I SAM-dependent methyltransferase n=1 Tax=Aspergillus ambiguus TaxID=176160 RepID=UPI003CCCD288
MAETATYTHGHHASVLRVHGQRTALNSAGFLLPHLKPHMKILDIGCGPGTITVDLATYVPEGHVTGLEMVGDVLSGARKLAESRGVKNIDFVTGDANTLAYADETFDVVFCHQVLQHVGDPIGILTEMKRVCKKGGIVAARESDYSVFMWYPELPGLKRWQDLYDKVARKNGGEPNAGRHLHVWARKAGFQDVDCTVSSWCFAKPEEVSWWSEAWQERILQPAFAKGAIDNGLATMEELEGISKVWREWGEDPYALISIPSAEVVCHKH